MYVTSVRSSLCYAYVFCYSRENLSCVANFVVVYSFLVAGIMWCIIFAYTWLIRSQTYGIVLRYDI